MSSESKLVDLRRKTDRDLMILAEGELNRGLTLAHAATTTESAPFAKAEKAYQRVKAWLPLISGLSQEERRGLGPALQELRTVLDRLSSETLRQDLVGVSD